MMKKLTASIFKLLLIGIFVFMGCAIKPPEKKADFGKDFKFERDTKIRKDTDKEFMAGAQNVFDVLVARQKTLLNRINAVVKKVNINAPEKLEQDYLKLLLYSQLYIEAYQVNVNILDRIFYIKALYDNDNPKKVLFLITAAQTTSVDLTIAHSKVTAVQGNLDLLDNPEEFIELTKDMEEIDNLFDKQWNDIMVFYKMFAEDLDTGDPA